MKIPLLLLIGLFGIAMKVFPGNRPDLSGEGQNIVSMGFTAHQDAKIAKSAPEALREPLSTGNVQCDQNWLSTRSAELISPSGVRASVEVRGKTLFGKATDDNRCERRGFSILLDRVCPRRSSWIQETTNGITSTSLR
jgi:hypothetical protein